MCVEISTRGAHYLTSLTEGGAWRQYLPSPTLLASSTRYRTDDPELGRLTCCRGQFQLVLLRWSVLWHIWCKENVLLIRCRNSQYAAELWLQNNKTGHTVGHSKLSLRECSSASSYSWTQATNLKAALLCRRWPIASKVCDRLSERRKMLTCSHVACVFVKRCVLLYVYAISTWNKWLSSRERKELAPVHLN